MASVASDSKLPAIELRVPDITTVGSANTGAAGGFETKSLPKLSRRKKRANEKLGAGRSREVRRGHVGTDGKSNLPSARETMELEQRMKILQRRLSRLKATDRRTDSEGRAKKDIEDQARQQLAVTIRHRAVESIQNKKLGYRRELQARYKELWEDEKSLVEELMEDKTNRQVHHMLRLRKLNMQRRIKIDVERRALAEWSLPQVFREEMRLHHERERQEKHDRKAWEEEKKKRDEAVALESARSDSIVKLQNAIVARRRGRGKGPTSKNALANIGMSVTSSHRPTTEQKAGVAVTVFKANAAPGDQGVVVAPSKEPPTEDEPRKMPAALQYPVIQKHTDGEAEDKISPWTGSGGGASGRLPPSPIPPHDFSPSVGEYSDADGHEVLHGEGSIADIDQAHAAEKGLKHTPRDDGASSPNMDIRNLVVTCIDAYKQYDPNVSSVNTYIEEYLHEYGIFDGNDGEFITLVFAGLVEYEKLIEAVLVSFYDVRGSPESPRNRLDHDIFMVFIYLILQLEELTWPTFRSFVDAFDADRMYALLDFVFSQENIELWFRDKWIALYDEDYVDNTLIKLLNKFMPQAQALLLEFKTVSAAQARETDPGEDSGTDSEEDTDIDEPVARSQPAVPVPKIVMSKD